MPIFGRCHMVRVLLGVVFILLVFGIYYKRSNYGVAVVRLPSEAIDSLSMTLEELNILTGANETCPVCYGRDACEELMSDISIGKLKVERKPFKLSEDDKISMHKVFRNGKERFWLKPTTADPHLMTVFEEAICRKDPRNRKSKIQRNCDLKSSSMVLQTNNLQVADLRKLFKMHLTSARRIPLTVCSTWKLLEGLVKAYDENSDNALTGDEKVQLITTLATNPEVAIYRFVMGKRLNFPLLPFFGACGRSTFIQGPLETLASYSSQSLPVKIELASEILQMVDGFINEDAEWIFFTSDLVFDNFVVGESGQVFLKDLSRVMLVRKDDQDGVNHDEEHADSNGRTKSKPPFHCDSRCFEDFYSGMVDDRNDKVPPGCSRISHYAGHMFTLVCKNILLGQNGLLHSIGNGKEDEDILGADASIVKGLLHKCSNSEDLNAREAAAIELLDLMTHDDDGDDEDDEEEENDDGDEEQQERDIGDEDLGEDQYAKTHDEKILKTKVDKYDFDDGGNLEKMKDMQFP